ncbi:expressed unknown protein [Seminavis robusta]|uniref:Transmembrane protein n=1 Tax=Seminavis robusta TaxID=568900 RepID=A0A9N8E1I1_9STRA|nr:expressed unknown protein [Seminavis robusta]|eukprot:Sro439_g143200.1 n/a (570) ;mRNA; r:29273-30982
MPPAHIVIDMDAPPSKSAMRDASTRRESVPGRPKSSTTTTTNGRRRESGVALPKNSCRSSTGRRESSVSKSKSPTRRDNNNNNNNKSPTTSKTTRRESTKKPKRDSVSNTNVRKESSTIISTNNTTTPESHHDNNHHHHHQHKKNSQRQLQMLEPSPPSIPRRLLLEDPMDGPWQRAKTEWKDPWSWFAIDDCGRLLDVEASFGSTQTVYKWILFGITMGTTIYLWSTADSAWFLGNLDHWALLFSLLYQALSLGNGHFQPPQPVHVEGLNLYVKLFWILFEVAAHLQIFTTLMFWVIVYPQQHSDIPIGYDIFGLHGVVLVAVWVDGMLLNRIPVRVKHYFAVLTVDAVYMLWTIIHAAAGLGNGTDGSTSSAIYRPLDWKNQTVQSVFLMIAMLTVFAPLLFAFQYCMSLYTFPWTWNGSRSRKCIEFDMSRSMANNPSSRRRPQPPPPPPPTPTPVDTTPPSPQKKKKIVDNSTAETSRTSSRKLVDQTVEAVAPKQPRKSILQTKKHTSSSNVSAITGAVHVNPQQPPAAKRPPKRNSIINKTPNKKNKKKSQQQQTEVPLMDIA